MYTYTGSKCLTMVTGAQWSTPDIENSLLRDVFFNYSKVFLSVENSFTNQVIYVAMDTYRSSYVNFAGTVAQWLTLMENSSLNTVVALPSNGYQYVQYANLNQKRFKILPTILGTTLPNNYSGLKPNLQISRSIMATDMSFLHTHSLVTVNGYIHDTFQNQYPSDFCFVKDGCTSAAIARINNIGAVTFKNIGELFKVRIDPANILPITEGQPLVDGLQFSIDPPNGFTSIAGKAVFLVMGGYMIFLENNKFSVIGNNAFRLNLRNLNFVEKILESSRYIDLSALGLTNHPEYLNGIDEDELFADDAVKSYLTLSQSFLVVLDATEIGINKITLKDMNTPGLYVSYNEPVFPLFVGYGRITEYWKRKEGNLWSLTVTDPYTRNYMFTSGTPSAVNSFIDSSTEIHHHALSKNAAMLEIGAKQAM